MRSSTLLAMALIAGMGNVKAPSKSNKNPHISQGYEHNPGHGSSRSKCQKRWTKAVIRKRRKKKSR